MQRSEELVLGISTELVERFVNKAPRFFQEFFLFFYVYFAFAFMTIAKKLGYDKPWLAWIPIANIFLFPILATNELLRTSSSIK